MVYAILHASAAQYTQLDMAACSCPTLLIMQWCTAQGHSTDDTIVHSAWAQY